jgi:hypothetical protein
VYFFAKDTASASVRFAITNSKTGIGLTSTPFQKVRFANSIAVPLGEMMDFAIPHSTPKADTMRR